jgi:ABC-type spermidine/putrescine transport system permease subunit II
MKSALRLTGRSVRIALVAVIVAFMFAPTVMMGILSFSNESYISFPPGHWGLHQYREALFGDRWMPALGRSLMVASATAVVALVVGALAVVALNRAGFRGRRVLHVVAVGPLLVPALAYAIALYLVLARVHLLGTLTGLVLAHSVLALPFVVLLVNAAAGRVPRDLEGAAMSLGAGRTRALLDITGRILLPAFAAALVLAFLTSFDEVVVASFVGGIGFETLPRAIFADLRSGADPAIAAVGMLLTVVTGVLLAALALLRKRTV